MRIAWIAMSMPAAEPDSVEEHSREMIAYCMLQSKLSNANQRRLSMLAFGFDVGGARYAMEPSGQQGNVYPFGLACGSLVDILQLLATVCCPTSYASPSQWNQSSQFHI